MVGDQSQILFDPDVVVEMVFLARAIPMRRARRLRAS
jgi:hypothetical protein